MTHGSGGRAMAQLIDELFLRRVRQPVAAADERPGELRGAGRPAGHGDRQPRRLAAVLSRRRHRLPVGARHHQRRRDGRRAAAQPRGVVHPRGGLSARGPEAHRRVDGAAPRAMRACRSSPATPRSSSAARATACSSPPPASASCRRGSTSPATARGPAIAILVSGTHRRPRRRDHVAAREPLLRDDDRVGHRRAARAGRGDDRGGAGHSLPARPHPRRARDHAERDRRAVGLRHADPRGERCRCTAEVSGRLRVPRPRPAVRRQRGQAGRDLCGRRRRSACWRRCARIRWAATRRSSAR